MAKNESFKLTNYDGGLPSHPRPEPSGTLVFPHSGAHAFKFELHWNGSKEFHHAGIARYRLDAVSTGRKSCRVSVVDNESPDVNATFELPDTSAEELNAAFSARVKALTIAQENAKAAQQRQEKISAGAWWLTQDAFKGLGLTKAFSLSESHYLGGWSGHTKTYTGMSKQIFTVDSSGIGLRGFRQLFVIPWDQIVDVEIEGPEQASKRVTATRVLALGVFALAARKKSKMSVIIVRLRSGEEAVFQSEKMTPPEVRARLAPILSQLRVTEMQHSSQVQTTATATHPPSAAVAPLSVADEIRKLAELREAGLLTEEEFLQQKSKLLQC